MKFLIVLSLLVIIFSLGCQGPVYSEKKAIPLVEDIPTSDTILVFAPHPDDEILGFCGLMATKHRQGVFVKVYVVTDGESGLGYACMWAFGKIDCQIPESLLYIFALARRNETRRALKLLGIDSVEFLGFGCKRLMLMRNFPDSIFARSDGKKVAESGMQITGKNLKNEIVSILNKYPTATIFTTDTLDSHPDHKALGHFIFDVVREMNFAGKFYTTVIHEPLRRREQYWPPPFLSVKTDCSQRERRYTPEGFLPPPAKMPLNFLALGLPDSIVLLKRKAVDLFGIPAGNAFFDGETTVYSGGPRIDCNGYMLSFVKKNEIFWEYKWRKSIK